MKPEALWTERTPVSIGTLWHQSCIAKFVITDTDMAYVGTAARRAGIYRFYTRRVLQRLYRGEISPHQARELLLAAAERGDARIESVIDVETNGR